MFLKCLIVVLKVCTNYIMFNGSYSLIKKIILHFMKYFRILYFTFLLHKTDNFPGIDKFLEITRSST